MKLASGDRRLSLAELAALLATLSLAIEFGSMQEAAAPNGDDEDELDRHVREAFERIRKEVAAGAACSGALERMGAPMTPEMVAVVREGEAAGRTAGALQFLADQCELQRELTRGTIDILAFPIIAGVVLAIVMVLITLFVFPNMEELFTGFGALLPLPTLVVLASMRYVVPVLLIAAIVPYGLLVWRRRHRGPAGPLDRALLRMPILAPFLRSAHRARVAHAIAGAAERGVPLTRAVAALRSITGYAVLAEQLAVMERETAGAAGFGDALRRASRLPGRIAQGVRIAPTEEALRAAVERAAASYANDARGALVRFQRRLYILMYATMGLLVGLMVVAVYMPIFKMGSVI